MTFVSDVDTRSTDMPCSLNTANTSARKPTWCHMPGLSSEMSVMPLRLHTAFTCAVAPDSPVISEPSRSGVCVAYTYKGIWYWRAGSRQRGCSTLAPLVAMSCASS